MLVGEGMCGGEPVASRVVDYFTATARQYLWVWSREHKHYGYWDEGVRSHARSLERMVEVVAETAGIEPGMVVLDAGCGWGGTAVWLARRGAVVCGITLVPMEVEFARGLAERAGVADSCWFEARDYTRTGFPDRSFDAVLALESSCYAEDKGAFVREAFRLLRPGGRLAIADGFARVPDSPLLRRWLECWAVPNLATLEGLARELERAGFVEVGWRDITAHVMPSSRRLFVLALLSWPAVAMAGAMRLLNPWEVANHRGAILQHALLRRGLAGYGLWWGRRP